MEVDREVARTQVKPVAGIWGCPICGRRIQVITDSETPKKQSFVCVCGATMEPGEEHAQVGADDDETGENGQLGNAVDG
jgi:hypothetical protein